ncbi:twin-arginine translocation signal domain-containing protein [Rhodobacteraceae bacterium NNCM2]|nr:twin-arginine translocation signal domain-containing protein [Coraliihabitans acroporae]
MGDKSATSRRDFLKLAATGAPVAAVATVAGGPLQAAEPEADTASYRETEHVRKYLDSARF